MKIKITQERHKCAESFEYFCEKYLKLNTPHGEIPFKLFEYQSRFIRHIEENRFSISKKYRQSGFTSLMAAWYFWRCIFKKDEAHMIMCKTDRMAVDAMYIIKGFVENLPSWLKPKFSKHNDHKMILEDTGCKLFCHAPESTCGRSLTSIYIDESAFIRDMDKFWKCAFPTIATGGRAIVVSTPNGTGNWFHETYWNADRGFNDFSVFNLDLSEHPKYCDIAWQREVHKNLGDKGYRQEVLQEFIDPNKDAVKVNFCDPNKIINKVSFDEIKSIQEEIALLQSLDSNYEPERQPHEIGKDNTQTTKVFVCGDDLIDCWDSWDKKPKPSVHEWEKIDSKTIHDLFEKDHKYYSENEVTHPDFDTSKIDTLEDISEFWDGMAEIDSKFNEIAKTCRKAVSEKRAMFEKIDENLNEYCDPKSLVIGGVIEKDEAQLMMEEMGEERVIRSGRLDIIEKILEKSDFPENINLGIHKEYLSINGVPTNIMTDTVKWAYMGLTGLTSHEEAIEYVASILKEKIKKLF